MTSIDESVQPDGATSGVTTDPHVVDPDRPLRSLIGTVYLPAAAYGIGQGAAAPVMVLAALQLGASAAVAGLTVALIGLGQVVGDTCSGQIVARLGSVDRSSRRVLWPPRDR